MQSVKIISMVVVSLYFLALIVQPSTSSPWQRSGSDSSKCGTLQEASLMNRNGKVLEGVDARPEEFPWMVSIKSIKGSNPSGEHVCGGFVVNSRHIISAAHCFRRKYNQHLDYKEDGSVIPGSVKISLGQYDLGLTENAKAVTIEYLAIHPEFEKGGHLNHDIAILRTDEEMVWDKNLSPICLPEVEVGEYVDTKLNVTLAGWGNTHCPNGPTPSNMLKKVTIPLWKNSDCLKAYQEADYDFTREGYVCAGDFKRDSSKGDSGSPLIMLQDNKWTAIGIVSAGRFMCEDRVPGVYTKISSYLSWIESEIK